MAQQKHSLPPLCSFNLPLVHSKFHGLIKNNNINKKLSPSSKRYQFCQPWETYLFRPELSKCMKYSSGFSMPRMCPLSAFNGENREIKLCWIWCCLLQTTWAENQRHKSHPRPFVASWIINTPADEQPCGKESPCELHICKRNLGKETLGKSPSTQESSLRLRCLSAMQPTLKNEGEKEEKKRKKKKNFPPAAYTYYDQQRKCKCVWAQSCTSFERGEQIPNALVNCVNHPSHPSRSESSNPHTYAHLTAKSWPWP